MLAVVMVFTLSFATAQTAIQSSKLTDNISLGVHGGLTGPMTLDLNKVFPLNTTLGLTLTKQVTPILGFNIEGITWLGSNASAVAGSRFDDYIAHNGFRAINLGANSTINLANLFSGYKGKPRVFEYGLEGGIGWLHTLVPNADNKNDFSVKTQLNLMLNIGKSRAHTLAIAPVIWWNLTGASAPRMSFNKNYSQAGLLLSYIYHFKGSHGTHYFKTYDIGTMSSEIQTLKDIVASQEEEIDNLKKIKVSAPSEIREKVEYVEVPAETVIYFAFDDYSLDDNAKAALDKIPALAKVCVIGTASTEGTEEYNLKLSQKRADAVADFLRERGVVVEGSEGKGISLGETSNRVAIVTPTE